MFALLKFFTAKTGNLLLTFRDDFCPTFLDCLTLEYGTSGFYHNDGNELPIYAEKYARRANIS